MSYKVNPSTSYGRMRRYVAQVIGGLESREATRARVDAWRALQQEVIAERGTREAADDVLLAAAARARVEDAEWDAALGATSSRAYELAKKDAGADPYATLFGKIDAKRARSMGLAKATAVGRAVVKDGRRLGVTELGAELETLEAATTRLEEAQRAVESAEDALFTPRLAKKKLVRKLNELIAVTEAAILTAFPGRDEIVSAILIPWFERRSGRGSAQPEPDPLVPDLDDEDEDVGGGPTA
ncbi:MAG: hypothetical protein IT385_17110 [Deltaproteobacteria bacterium]|nr:hypothetical protein [Deltaproteobacteria bacterium]